MLRAPLRGAPSAPESPHRHPPYPPSALRPHAAGMRRPPAPARLPACPFPHTRPPARCAPRGQVGGRPRHQKRRRTSGRHREAAGQPQCRLRPRVAWSALTAIGVRDASGPRAAGAISRPACPLQGRRQGRSPPHRSTAPIEARPRPIRVAGTWTRAPPQTRPARRARPL